MEILGGAVRSELEFELEESVALRRKSQEGDDVGCLVGLFRRLLPAFRGFSFILKFGHVAFLRATLRKGPTVPGARYVPCGHLAALDEIEQDVRQRFFLYKQQSAAEPRQCQRSVAWLCWACQVASQARPECPNV